MLRTRIVSEHPLVFCVIAGLARKKVFGRAMDARVSPAHDGK
jgi:hypothetical protein